jgi:imidazolonepropionase-like amidohydrolase
MGSQQTQKVFRAARVWPSSAVGLIEDGVVAVEGDRIAFAGAWADVKDQYPAESIRDLGNVTLMPGLFDCHVSVLLVTRRLYNLILAPSSYYKRKYMF